MTPGRRLLSIVLGVILTWAALGKIANLQEFYAATLAYQLPLPSLLLKLTAIVLPWVELIVGLLLMFDPSRSRSALVLAAGLFGVFTLVTAQAWLRGLTISCGCLDLSFLGIPPGTFLEAVWFACLRAGLLLATSIWMLGRR